MKSSILNYLTKPKTVIGWAHGIIATLSAVILSYLLGTILSMAMTGDYAQRIIPSMVLTPLLLNIFGIWLLFSKSLARLLIKIFGLSSLLSIAMLAQMNGLM